MLSEAEKYPNVKLHFNHKLIKCDSNTGEIELENTETKELVTTKTDLIIGSDGTFSNVRASMLKSKPMEFSQSYASGKIFCLKFVYLTLNSL